MRESAFWQAVTTELARQLDRDCDYQEAHAVGGGCINQGWRLTTGAGVYFVKTNIPAAGAMFASEAAGLRELAAAGAVRVPAPLYSGALRAQALLVTEWLELVPADSGSDAVLGEQLAVLHRHTARHYGWTQDNYIGSTPQPNQFADDWCGFLRERRLGHQFALAARNGYGGSLQTQGAKLLANLPVFFGDYTPAPSLLHGDLWNGNRAALAGGVPVIFDPAVYYGDRETDLAMTELFGGFGRDFYAAYNAVWPLDAGYRTRKQLYQLYHVLNHLNLFGGSYLQQARLLLGQLLSESG